MAKHKFIDETGTVLCSCDSIRGLKAEIIKAIKLHLVYSRNGCVEHYINDVRTNRYSNNPKNGKASLSINKGDRIYFKSI